ncbi:hypothetical protein ACHWQZ_G018084 [Mnemiopsis leidyi]
MLVFLLVASASLPLVNVFPLDGQNKGCAHDGKEVDVGETLVVGCDTCTCIPGKIVCPTPPTCPRNCSYKGEWHEHGTKWTNEDTCDTCVCRDGTSVCTLNDCNGACSVNGLHYMKGESFKVDCETCMCMGHDLIKCNKHFCPCFIENKIIQHGEEILDKTDPRGSLTYRCEDGRVVIAEDNRKGASLLLARDMY